MFERENINFFIQAARSYGVPIQDLFQVGFSLKLELLSSPYVESVAKDY